MYDEIGNLLIQNIRFYLRQSWQSQGYGGSPNKNGIGPKIATSKLYNNITKEIQYDEDGFPESFVIFMEDYWFWIDEGRKPGGFPRVDKIRQWVLDKPVTWRSPDGSIPSIQQRTYLIGRSIAEKGYAGTNFTELATEKTLNEALDKFGDEFANDIQDFLDQRIFVGQSQQDLIL
jgi:hypothetical protein